MKQYGLIGYPLTHSFSKKFFTEKFKAEGIDACYNNFEIKDISELTGIIGDNPALKGLNVTIPYKEQVMQFLDVVEESAENIGAVNTIKIVRHANAISLHGYNTDTRGFKQSVSPLLKDYHKKALILGTGGASKAVKYVLEQAGIDYLSASTSKAGNEDRRIISYDAVDKQVMEECLIIINATPLGTYPNVDTFPPIPYGYLTKRHLLYDLVYNPEVTKFLEKGQQRGAVIKNGFEMLVEQALAAYDIWEH